MSKLLVLFFMFFSISIAAQEIVYKSNGNIYDANKNRLTPDSVRALLADNEELLYRYNQGRTKKTVGNVLMIGGLAFLTADMIIALKAAVVYPGALTYIGAAAFVIAIPVKLGFSKRIKNVVDQYNNNNNNNNNKSVGFINDIQVITNQNGIGMRVTLN